MSKIMMFSSPTQLVLASGSSYRKALLDRLGLQFTVSAADIDESPLPGEAPCALAERLAIEKARAVAPRFPGHLIIGSDQVATLDGITTLGKPMSHVRAVEQLTALSGKEAYFHTAVCLLNATTGVLRSTLVTTTVEFRTLLGSYQDVRGIRGPTSWIRVDQRFQLARCSMPRSAIQLTVAAGMTKSLARIEKTSISPSRDRT